MGEVTDRSIPLKARDLERWLHAVADPIRLGVIRTLHEAEHATAGELARRCQASRRTLERHLEAMITSGLVEEKPGESDGMQIGRPAARFYLAPSVQNSVRRLLASYTCE